MHAALSRRGARPRRHTWPRACRLRPRELEPRAAPAPAHDRRLAALPTAGRARWPGAGSPSRVAAVLLLARDRARRARDQLADRRARRERLLLRPHDRSTSCSATSRRSASSPASRGRCCARCSRSGPSTSCGSSPTRSSRCRSGRSTSTSGTCRSSTRRRSTTTRCTRSSTSLFFTCGALMWSPVLETLPGAGLVRHRAGSSATSCSSA